MPSSTMHSWQYIAGPAVQESNCHYDRGQAVCIGTSGYCQRLAVCVTWQYRKGQYREGQYMTQGHAQSHGNQDLKGSEVPHSHKPFRKAMECNQVGSVGQFPQTKSSTGPQTKAVQDLKQKQYRTSRPTGLRKAEPQGAQAAPSCNDSRQYHTEATTKMAATAGGGRELTLSVKPAHKEQEATHSTTQCTGSTCHW
jgi:hypothetical protein